MLNELLFMYRQNTYTEWDCCEKTIQKNYLKCKSDFVSKNRIMLLEKLLSWACYSNWDLISSHSCLICRRTEDGIEFYLCIRVSYSGLDRY